MIQRAVGGGGCGGTAAHLNDLRAALSYARDELVVHPCCVQLVGDLLAIQRQLRDVRELGGGVVAPHDHVLQVANGHAQLLRHLSQAAVVVQAGQGGDAAGIQPLGVGGDDRGVGVCRVADHDHAHVVGSVLGNGLALGAEDLAVGGQQVGALLAFLARLRTDQEHRVGVLEALVDVGGDGDLAQQWVGAVGQLQRHATCSLHTVLGLQQSEVHHPVAEDFTLGDAEQQGVADLATRTRNGDGDGVLVVSGHAGLL